jgi:peptidyl-prolyl cis-trans isomerase D
MAVIGSIRKRSTLLLIVIGGALVLFVLSDFLMGQGGGSRSQKIEPLAEIFGEDLDFRQVEFEVQQQIDIQKESNPDYSPSGNDLFNLRQQRYTQKVRELIYMKYCTDIGLALKQDYSTLPAISLAEFRDMLMGSDPHPEIRRVFTDQSGRFDPARVKEVLDNLEQLDPVQRLQWHLFLEELKRERLTTKYQNLVTKSFYYPTAMARLAYHHSSDQANFRFVAKRYESIDDDSVELTDEDFKRYYEENKKQWDREAQATINFVTFEARPTPSDIAAIEGRFMELFEQLSEVEDPEVFLNVNSHDRYDSTWFRRAELPVMIDSMLFDAEPGAVYGPFVDQNKFKGAILLDATNRPDSLRASHILLSFRGAGNADESVSRTRAEAELLADSLLTEIKANPSIFDMLAASSLSDDVGSRMNSGDLNWFVEQMMVPEFSAAVLSTDVNEVTVAESRFGFHIIKVTGKKNFSRQVRVAILTRDIEPSRETIAAEFTRASRFNNSVTSLESFESMLETEGVSGSEAALTKDNYSVQNMRDGREIVRWAFNKENTPGKSVRMFEFPDRFQFVVVILKSRREKGIWQLDDELKKFLEPLVIKEKKFEMAAAELSSHNTQDINRLASNMGLSVDTATISFNMSTIINYGPEGRVIGTAFGMPKGKLSRPVKGINSAFVLLVDERVRAGDTEDFSMAVMSEERLYRQLMQQNFDRALEKAANIIDNRILWF